MNYYGPDPEIKAGEKRGGLIGIVIGGLIGVVGAVLQLNALEDAWDWTALLAIGFSALVFGVVGWVVGSLWGRSRAYKARFAGRVYQPQPQNVFTQAARAVPQPGHSTPQPGHCVKCGKALQERTAQALFTPGMSISDNTTYPCKSCGAIYCLDCMSKLKTSGQTHCVQCSQPHGW